MHTPSIRFAWRIILAAALLALAAYINYSWITSPSYLPVGFETLSGYNYNEPWRQDKRDYNVPVDSIPSSIHALNGRRVAVRGYMVPINLKNGMTTRFLLLKFRESGCWGPMPRMNEWMTVTLRPGESVRCEHNRQVTVYGILEVGERYEDFEIASIYRCNAESVSVPPPSWIDER